MAAINYVAKLNEFAQRSRSVLRYEDVGAVGPDHIKKFTVRAIVNNKVFPDGMGNSKKEARQNAAENALRGLLEESSNCQTENTAEASTTPIHQTIVSNNSYVCWLNEYGNKNKVFIRTVVSTRLGPINGSNFVVGGKEFPAGFGKTKREAKEEAAKLVYHEICGSKANETRDEKYGGTSSQQKEEAKQDVIEICDRTNSLSAKTEGGNYIGLLNQYCQKTKHSHDYVLERRCGQAHSPQFFYKLVINNKEYPVGEGKTVKEAKQNAAQLAWAALQEQTNYDSKVTVSDESASASLPTLSNSPDAQSKSKQIATSDSGVFIISPKPPKHQAHSADVKPKIRLAANFQNAQRQSKEAVTNFNDETPGNSHCKKTAAKSVTSRFTSHFDAIECLGKGAFGYVFKAKEKLLDKYYAVKIVRCKQKALREVGALSDLQHCNIVRYYTCWMEDSSYQMDSSADSSSSSQSSGTSTSTKYLYIQMELCDIRTLRVWINEKNIQNVKKSLRDSKRREESQTIAGQIVSGVEYIHSKMFIHRDLKPANILFGREGQVKIGDFGLVTAENDDDAENLIERTEYKGTPSYMAPEQKSRSTYDRKVDIFALGLIYFELLWNLSGDRKVIWEDARNQKLPQEFSQNFLHESQIIKSMLCLKPEDRPEAGKLKKDLQECTYKFTTLKNKPHESYSI